MAQCVNLREVIVQPVAAPEEARFQALMGTHHYLGALPKIGHTLWYVATWQSQWLALLSFSAAAWKCAAESTGPGSNTSEKQQTRPGSSTLRSRCQRRFVRPRQR